MKVGVITCHKVYNYGASLQSYALQHYLKKKGIKAYLINYLPDLFRSKYNLFFVREDRRKIVTKFPILKLLMPLSNRQMLITWGRKKLLINLTQNTLIYPLQVTHLLTN